MRIGEAREQLALVGLPGDNGDQAGLGRDESGLTHIETQPRLARALVGAVALETMVGEDGTDVAIEIDGRGRRRRRGRGESQGDSDDAIQPHRASAIECPLHGIEQ